MNRKLEPAQKPQSNSQRLEEKKGADPNLSASNLVISLY